MDAGCRPPRSSAGCRRSRRSTPPDELRDGSGSERRVSRDVEETAARVVIVTDKEQSIVARAADAIRAHRKTPRITRHQPAERLQRGAEAGRQDDVVEGVFGTV